ncbi:PAS domain S-box protein [Synechocystis sp. LKSZ1]|uniref:PAS domain S-box protein n=1 Tax=Synechocystis sp. LKSZ1 TaxID=3144951 RepID=UPI00336BD374
MSFFLWVINPWLFFQGNGYIPHGHCYLWQTPLVWLHLLSDSFTAIAYYSIPLLLLYFLRKRQDIPFPNIIALFSAFILCCGTSHVFDVITLWFPIYWISGLVKALMAIVSVFTVFELIQIIPLALNLSSPKQLEGLNQALTKEIQERQAAELALQELNGHLEERVKARTAELAQSNQQLEQNKNQLAQLAAIVKSSQDAIISKTPEGIITSWNQAAERLFGYTSQEMIGQSIQRLIPVEYREEEEKVCRGIRQGKIVQTYETKRQRKDGSLVDVALTVSPIWDDEGNVVGASKIARDISERLTVETREIVLREMTQRIRQSLDLPIIFETVVQEIRQFLQADRVAIFQFEPNTHFEFGSIVAESVIPPFSSVLSTRIQETCFSGQYAHQYQQGRIQVIEDLKQAKILPCHAEFLGQFQVRANLVLPLINNHALWGLLCVHQCSAPRTWQTAEINFLKQITNQFEIAIQQASLYQQAQQELVAKNQLFAQLKSELEQKKILLKEIHHRVKNNLQIMSSLLYLQFSKASAEIQAMSEGYQSRIQSMALIHEQLYRSDDLACIDFCQYVANLTNNIFQGYGQGSRHIHLNLAIKNLTIPLEQAIPLGLIVHELVSNALKYAFPNGEGEITIQLTPVGRYLHLEVADNGVGLPPDLDLDNTDSLGMQLIQSLTEQLQGNFHYTKQGGARFCIDFPL